MADLRALSHACTEALADADRHGAKIAAHFLRVQVRELFRECVHQAHEIAQADTALIPKPKA
jgi:hypothetical protein